MNRWAKRGAEALALFVLSALLVFASIYFTREVGRVAAIWPLNAVILAFLMHRPRAAWRNHLAIVCFANVIVNAALGDPPIQAIALAVANLVEIALCAWLLTKSGQPDLSRFEGLARFVAVAGVGAPMASALIAALTLSADASFVATFVNWTASDGLGMLIFGSALLVLTSRRSDGAATPTFREVVSAAAVFAGALALVFMQRHYPLLFLVPPALMYVTFRLGMRGAAAGVLATALFAIGSTFAGLGPVQLVADETAKLFTLQVFLAVIAISTLPVAAALSKGARSIADLSQARASAEQARLAADESAQRYKDLSDYSTDIIVRFGPRGIISHASPAVRLIGLTPDEAVGLSLMDFVAPEDTAFAQKVVAGLFAGPEPEPMIRREFRIRRPDGSVIWLEGNPNIIRDEQGNPIEVLSVFRDVTKRRELEDHLMEARREAEVAAEAKGAFLAHMSHEIRTPLNSIIGFARLLKDEVDLGPQGRRYADIVGRSSGTLLSLINDVLDVAKFEVKAIALAPEPIALAAKVRSVVEELQVLASNKSLAFRVEIGEGLAAYHLGDKVRLRQILLNLISNAIKFTEAGEVTVRVSTDGDADPQLVRIEVQDTGIGIAEDKIPHLFERFAQADASVGRRFGGTGLGLAIVREIVDLMNGRLGVNSRVGMGSCFWIELRLPVAGLPACRGVDAPESDATQPKRILIVDDLDLNRELACVLLSGLGHDIETAADGAQAVQMAQAWPFDIIFMDVQMPGVDGLSATRSIRAIYGLEALPIVAMTAQALPHQIVECHAAGMNDYVPKPLAPDALRNMVSKWCGATEGASEMVGEPVSDALRERFVALCTENSGWFQAALDNGLELRGDGQERAHRLAGVAAIFGFKEVGEIAGALDAKLRQNQVPDPRDITRLIGALEGVRAA